MIKFIAILILGIFILKNLSNIITIIVQLIVTWIGFVLHPFLGIFLLLAYIADWLEIIKEKDYNKNKERTNSYFNNRPYDKQKKEENKQQKKTQQETPKTNHQQKTSGFFTGCTTKEQLKKRHRELCKKYHPDKGGDVETFKRMQAEYERLIIKFK